MGKDGVAKIHGLGDIAGWEKELLDACLKDLASNIKKVSLFWKQYTNGFFRARTLLLQIPDTKVDLMVTFARSLYQVR